MFYPHFYHNSVFEVPYDELFAKGIRGLVYDIDNTLATHAQKHPPAEIIALVNDLHSKGFRVALLSNNSPRRVNVFNELLNLPGTSRAAKPFTKTLKSLMKEMELTPEQTAIIGDQVFADVWCGIRAGITTVLVKPISPKEIVTVRMKRGLERLVLKKYERMQNE